MNKDFSGIFKFKVRRSTTGTSSKKRSKSNNIFAPMSVAHVDDEGVGPSPGPGEVYHAEKVFNNGDLYTGEWVDNLPNGNGKYLWNDGCMYVGEWCNGKTNGKGRFSWPSGATYEGDFKNGYMDGKGTYSGSNGDTYRGFWVMNMRHGNGTKNYVNGDCYDGDWKRGVQEGEGKYEWVDGNCYVGGWENGGFHGNGILSFVNGNKFEGVWEGGCPKGEGSYTLGDGTSYVGVWSLDSEEMNVTCYPGGGAVEPQNPKWDPQELYSVDLSQCKICVDDDEILMFPSDKMISWPSFGGRMGRKSIEANGGRKHYSWDHDVQGMADLHVHDTTPTNSPPILLPKTIKRQGVTICKGHKNYELMLNLQLGIRYTSCKISFLNHIVSVVMITFEEHK